MKILGKKGWLLSRSEYPDQALKPFIGAETRSPKTLRKALLAGYAAKLARRMPRHNGYKTLGPRSTLAQLHPSSATLGLDEEGMLPQWIVFHELLQTARTFLSKVNSPYSTHPF